MKQGRHNNGERGATSFGNGGKHSFNSLSCSMSALHGRQYSPRQSLRTCSSSMVHCLSSGITLDDHSPHLRLLTWGSFEFITKRSSAKEWQHLSKKTVNTPNDERAWPHHHFTKGMTLTSPLWLQGSPHMVFPLYLNLFVCVCKNFYHPLP